MIDDLMEILENAFDDAGVPRRSYVTQARGDGGRFDFDGISPVTILRAVLGQLSSRLRTHNRSRSASQRLDLRLALHDGYVVPRRTDRDNNGPAANLLHGILDSAELKGLLEVQDQGWVLALSESIWSGILRPGYGDFETATFEPMEIAVKHGSPVAVWTTSSMNYPAVPLAMDPGAENQAAEGVRAGAGHPAENRPGRAGGVFFGGPVTISGAGVVEGDGHFDLRGRA
ncbi:hypothetical protein GCM10009751_10970 [Myceligenerans crystallogenes]|uniref:Uncharacterized protein n=1 Tax=Myceligenerans crystallogenes TaxID=316335 RepID=A0ABN2N820_9MICO